jgi:outer membrane protein TolC
MRVQLVESTRAAFYELYLAHRALVVNADALEQLRQFRANAEARFMANQAPQQDLFQADVEIGRQRERGVALERARRVAVARINTLLHQPPDAPLAPPPERLPSPEPPPPVDSLRSLAVARRPDLKALADRVAAEEVNLGLAHKEYLPDFDVSAAYDTIMGNGPARPLAPQVGVRLNLPVRLARRDAAVVEAQAKIAQRRAELAARADQVNLQVQEAYEQVVESEQVVRLYVGDILPAARQNVKAAQPAYMTGKVPFLSLVEAQRNLIGLSDRHYEAVADYYRRRAALERAIGGPLPGR